jgi:hypothetical protein
LELRGNIVADLAQTVTNSITAMTPSLMRRSLLPMILLAVSVAIRWPTFGDPNYHIDEVFYLLVGDRMHDGMLPYVDIWDRKPFGLFILYWLITFFGGVCAYQIIAGLSVWVTSWIVAAIVHRWHALHVAVMCGTIYIATLSILAGGGGQTPVFYNLFIAIAGLLTLNCLTDTKLHRITMRACIAMLLCGIAITIKQTCAVEGAFFGLLLVWRCWRLAGTAPAARRALIFALFGLLPTILCLAGFTAIGYGATYFSATMQTIFLTQPASAIDQQVRVNWLLAITTPLIITCAGGLIFTCLDRKINFDHKFFITGWLAASLGGFFLVPNFYDHYAIPLATTAAITAAPFIATKYIGPTVAVLIVSWSMAVSGYPQIERTNISIKRTESASYVITANLGKGCLFAFDTPAILYYMTGSCLPTSRIFPEHLSNARESLAIGIDPVAETARVLKTRPSVIAISEEPTLKTFNAVTRSMVKRALTEDYILINRVTMIDIVGPKPIQIWRLKTQLSLLDGYKAKADSLAPVNQ